LPYHTYHINSSEHQALKEFIFPETKPFGVQTFKTLSSLSRIANEGAYQGKLMSISIPLFMQQIDRFLNTCENYPQIPLKEKLLATRQFEYLYAKNLDEQQYIALFLMGCYVLLCENIITPLDESVFGDTDVVKKNYQDRCVKYQKIINNGIPLFTEPIPVNLRSAPDYGLMKQNGRKKDLKPYQHKYRISVGGYQELKIFTSFITAPRGFPSYESLSQMSRHINFAYLECSL
jgi:hypothetical protein